MIGGKELDWHHCGGQRRALPQRLHGAASPSTLQDRLLFGCGYNSRGETFGSSQSDEDS